MVRTVVLRWVRLVTVLIAWPSFDAAWTQAAEPIIFNRDIRPILSDRCFVCHGPDSASRQADLRLDQRDAAVAARADGSAIVPGHAGKSAVYQRIRSTDPDERMPPADSGLKLSQREIELLGRWIDEGAQYQPHWSFIAPVRPKRPQAKAASNPIDRFVGARLAAQKLTLAREADRPALIRRVTFDLTGLPPTPAEIDAFLADRSPDAYEKVVDRLLTSPRYGERMATPWLDAARYADTNGYQSDEARHMWRWRDWVIEAFNRNTPFDQFTIEQLAGDLLPGATLEQKIATGFNRNHRANSEGGIIPEEFLVEYAVDRLDTTATVWLGLTIGCARCHDHKYDPISQKDFYRLMAFFNNVPELGKVSRTGNSDPVIAAPTADLAAQIEQADVAVAKAEQRWRARTTDVAAAQAAWEQTVDLELSEDVLDGLSLHLPLDGAPIDVRAKPAEDKSAAKHSPAASFVDGTTTFAEGQIGKAAEFAGGQMIEITDVGDLKATDRLSMAAWIWPAGDESMGVFSKMDETDSYLGYGVSLNEGKVLVELCNRVLDDSVRLETTAKVETRRWHHVLVTYDGSRSVYGVRIYVDGRLQKTSVLSNSLSLVIHNDQPLRIGARGTSQRFRGKIDDVRLYERVLSADEAATLASSETIGEIAAMPSAKRSAAQATKLHAYYLKHALTKPLAKVLASLNQARQARKELDSKIPTTMVMQEKPTRGETFVLVRGQYDKPGERVEPGVPGSLPPLDVAPEKADRLALARWLVSGRNPLVARVTVNRFWQMYFGIGLVKTVEDFGSQGEVPVDQDLLDWLSVEFIESGWDVKAMQRLIVTSATYRQSSAASAALWARDPENRLLARGPRERLPAEMIRDAALSAAGLLVERIGGPSVKPYQPPGLYEELKATVGTYVPDTGESLYRRSMYTFWKRTIPSPVMMVFDAAGREACTVRRSSTNTPLQALALLNDVPYVEAARGLAQRMMREAGPQADSRIDHGFRLVMARHPSPRELEVLRSGFERHLARFRSVPKDAARLATIGKSPPAKGLDPAELAAYSVTASVILNLDEAITKE